MKLELELEKGEVATLVFLLGIGLGTSKFEKLFPGKEGELLHDKVLLAVKKAEDADKKIRKPPNGATFYPKRNRKKEYAVQKKRNKKTTSRS